MRLSKASKWPKSHSSELQPDCGPSSHTGAASCFILAGLGGRGGSCFPLLPAGLPGQQHVMNSGVQTGRQAAVRSESTSCSATFLLCRLGHKIGMTLSLSFLICKMGLNNSATSILYCLVGM